MALLLSVLNEKGGVGKTTTSLNLAFEMSRKGFNVMLMDLDKQCDLTKTVLRQPWDLSIKEYLDGNCTLDDILYMSYDNFYFIPGSIEIRTYKDNGADLLQMLANEKMFERMDYVIIDHPPEIHDASIKGILASDYIVIVTEVETFSIDNLEPVMKTLEAISEAKETPLNILGVVANKIDYRRNQTQKNLERLSRLLGDDLFETSIGTNATIPYAIQEGVPTRVMAANKAARQYASLATEVLERIGRQ